MQKYRELGSSEFYYQCHQCAIKYKGLLGYEVSKEVFGIMCSVQWNILLN